MDAAVKKGEKTLMGFAEEYRSKLTTAEEAVKAVKSGDWVDYGWCTATALELDKALAKRAGELEDVKLRGGILMWETRCIRRSRGSEAFHLEFLAHVGV